jgi:hypothetical protein
METDATATPHEQEFLSIRRNALLSALRVIETIVVSLDRMGACAHEFSEQQNNAILARFIDDWDTTRKLLYARHLLSEPFSREIGEDELNELEREMESVPYWSLAHREPPPGFAEGYEEDRSI